MPFQTGLGTVMSKAVLHLYAKQIAPIPLDAEIEVRAGELLALVGPSGSGKTTLLRTIAGLYRPQTVTLRSNQEIWADSKLGIYLAPHHRAVGLVFQSYALFPHMTALGNVMAAMGHRPAKERNRRAQDLLQLVHLGGLADRRPHQLSGGQQQRVAVARALARDPEVLLLDEPFSAVDKATRQTLYRELTELRHNLSVPIVLVTHDFDEAARLADRMSLLYQGRLLQTGTPADVLARPVNGTAARLVDLKNMFRGKIVGHERMTTVINWQGRKIMAKLNRDFRPEESVLWALPSTQVVLGRGEPEAPKGSDNLFAGTIKELVTLSESMVVTVVLDGSDQPLLMLTVPAHYVRRNAINAGSPITVSLLSDGIHIMKGERSDDQRCKD